MRFRFIAASALAFGLTVTSAQAQTLAPGSTEEKETLEGLAAFYAIQVQVAECGIKVAPKDIGRINAYIQAMEKILAKPVGELAQLKARALVDVKSSQEKVCAEARLGVASLSGVFDQLDKEIASGTGLAPAPQAQPLVVADRNVAPGSNSAGVTSSRERRNPFGVADVADPYGQDIQQFAARVRLSGSDTDPNARQWVTKTGGGVPGSLDGEWFGRWEEGSGSNAEIQVKGDRFYAIYSDGQGRLKGKTWIIEAVIEPNHRLVGRWVQVGNPRDTGPFVAKVVSDERIDGVWSWDGRGRWDFRRKLR